MNIFILDKDITLNAQYTCDKHIVKMQLESAQMLCTSYNILTGTQIFYKSSHVNHPCAIWTRASYENFQYLFNLLTALHTEWQYRYNKAVNHKSFDVGTSLNKLVFPGIFPSVKATPHPLCMPDNYKTGNDVVNSYRNYYKGAKGHLLKYTKREPPYWI
jgi:hypothetical protein